MKDRSSSSSIARSKPALPRLLRGQVGQSNSDNRSRACRKIPGTASTPSMVTTQQLFPINMAVRNKTCVYGTHIWGQFRFLPPLLTEIPRSPLPGLGWDAGTESKPIPYVKAKYFWISSFVFIFQCDWRNLYPDKPCPKRAVLNLVNTNGKCSGNDTNANYTPKEKHFWLLTITLRILFYTPGTV